MGGTGINPIRRVRVGRAAVRLAALLPGADDGRATTLTYNPELGSRVGAMGAFSSRFPGGAFA